MFGTRLLFALNMSLCFWLVPSFGNWQHRFDGLPRFGLVWGKRLQLRLSGGGLLPCNWLPRFRRLRRFDGLPRFGLVRGKRLQLRLSGGGLLPCNWQPRLGRLHHFGRQLRFCGTMPILKPTHGIGI